MNTLRFSLRASVLLASLSPVLHADSLTVEGDLNTTGNVTIGTVPQAKNLNVSGDVTIAGALEVDGQAVVTADQLATYVTATQLTGYVTASQLSGAGYLTTSGSGASLTNLNAGALSAGTISVERLPAAVSQLGATIELNGVETTGNLDWTRVNKTGSSLADLTTRSFSSLQSIPTTLSGYGITDAVAKDGSGNVVVTGMLTVNGEAVATANQLAGYLSATGSGASLTDLNASALTSGTIAVGRLPSSVSQLGTTIELDGAETTGDLEWTRVSKDGSSLADLATRNFAALQSTPTTLSGYGITDAVAKDGSGNVVIAGTLTVGGQTVATANQLTGFATTSQLTGYLATNGSGANLTNLNASALSTGTLPAGVLPAGVTQLGNTIELGGETTGQLAWSSVDKATASLADLPTRDFADLQNRPVTLAGYGITDAVQKNAEGDVAVAGSTTLTGAVTIDGVATVNRRVAKLRVERQGDLSMGAFTAGSTIP